MRRSPLRPHSSAAQDLRELSEPTLAAVVAEIGGVALTAEDQLPPIVDVLERSGVVPSKAAARRAIAEGGAYLNNVRVHDQEAMLTPGRPAARAFRDCATGQAHGRRCHGREPLSAGGACAAIGCRPGIREPRPALHSRCLMTRPASLTGRRRRRKVYEASAGCGTRKIA